jgi:hypothetical protein
MLLDTITGLLLRADESLASQAERGADEPFENEQAFWLATELRFCVVALHFTALQSLRSALVGGARGIHGMSSARDSPCSPEEAAQRVNQLATLRQQLVELSASRLTATCKEPLAIQLAKSYGFTPVEQDVLLLLVLLQGHHSELFASICMEDADDGLGDAKLLRTLTGMTALELTTFLEEERVHSKEGLLQLKEDDFSPQRSVSVPPEVCEVLLRGQIDAEKLGSGRAEKLRLKLAGTRLLELLSDPAETAPAASAPKAVRALSPPSAGESAVFDLLRALNESDEEGAHEPGPARDGAGLGAGDAEMHAALAEAEASVEAAKSLAAEVADEAAAAAPVGAAPVGAAAPAAAGAPAATPSVDASAETSSELEGCKDAHASSPTHLASRDTPSTVPWRRHPEPTQ